VNLRRICILLLLGEVSYMGLLGVVGLQYCSNSLSFLCLSFVQLNTGFYICLYCSLF
jgi:hypothetical protein